MTYVDAEVVAVCREKGWRRQIRRKWAVRETPLSRSGIDDYEWKLIPGERKSSDAADEEVAVEEHSPSLDVGTYFVLGMISSKALFVLQHSTLHGGVKDDDWRLTRTYTEIDLGMLGYGNVRELPPRGRLARYLSSLVTEFKPNTFSIT